MERGAPSTTRRALIVLGVAAVGVVALWLSLSAWSSRRLTRARSDLDATLARQAPSPEASTPPSAADEDVVRWLFEGTAAL